MNPYEFVNSFKRINLKILKKREKRLCMLRSIVLANKQKLDSHCGLKLTKTNADRLITIDKILLENNFDSIRVTRSKIAKGNKRGKKSQDLQRSNGISLSEKSKIKADSRDGNSIKRKAVT